MIWLVNHPLIKSALVHWSHMQWQRFLLCLWNVHLALAAASFCLSRLSDQNSAQGSPSFLLISQLFCSSWYEFLNYFHFFISCVFVFLLILILPLQTSSCYKKTLVNSITTVNNWALISQNKNKNPLSSTGNNLFFDHECLWVLRASFAKHKKNFVCKQMQNIIINFKWFATDEWIMKTLMSLLIKLGWHF